MGALEHSNSRGSASGIVGLLVTLPRRLERLMSHASMLMTVFAIVTLLFSISTQAQLLTADNVPLTLSGGVSVTVEGALQLQNSAIVDNNGILRVQSDWTNNSGNSAVTATSTGTVELYGTATQNIQGTNVTDFRNLRLLNGPKQQLQDAVVGLPTTANGTLELGVGGTLVQEGSTFTVFNPAGTAVVDNGGWVVSEEPSFNSRFQWTLGNDLTEHRVPFGEPSGPSFPFAFTPAAALPANTILSISTYRTAPDNTAYPILPPQEVTHVRDQAGNDNSDNTVDRYWLVDLPDGAFTGDLLLGHAPIEDPLFGPGPIRAQRWNEATIGWDATLPGQSNPALRQALVPAVPFSNAFAPNNAHIWALAYELSPLPITLLHFGAEAKDNSYVHCTWTTANEQDNEFFTVERSRDGSIFEDIGEVTGAGNSLSTLYYSFDDLRPYTGLSYYRLRQTDFDGTETWSQAVPVMITRDVDVSVFPNPNRGQFTILRSNAEEALDMHLMDGAGRLVRQWTMPIGMDRLAVDLDAASGLYTLRWNSGQAKVSVGRSVLGIRVTASVSQTAHVTSHFAFLRPRWVRIPRCALFSNICDPLRVLPYPCI